MYFLALATDYDGTIAHNGSVTAETTAALKLCKETGRRLILVTGRELPDIKRAYPEIKLFDRVVAENGALIYDPSTEEEGVIAAAPPAIFVGLELQIIFNKGAVMVLPPGMNKAAGLKHTTCSHNSPN